VLVQEGLRLQQSGNVRDAEYCYLRALDLDGACFDALQLLGVLRFRTGDAVAGIELMERALALRPGHTPTLNNLGNALRSARRLNEALCAYREAAARSAPPNALILRNLGSVLLELGDLEEAHAQLLAALPLAPRDATLWCWFGHLQRARERFEEAAEAYRRALALEPNLIQALQGLGMALTELARPHEALEVYSQALALDPQFLVVAALRADLRLGVADWSGWDEDCATLIAAKPGAGHGVDPLRICYFTDEPQVLRDYADAHADYATSGAPPLHIAARPQRRATRIRIAYLSADIREHPAGRLLAPVIETHERADFEIRVYALGDLPQDPVRQRIARACEHFISLQNPSDRELAEMLLSDEIDVLIDLMGHTVGSRPRVLAAHPAPAQVSWLGYPSTLGGRLVDYFVADAVTVPPGAEWQFTEHLIRLPHCFMPGAAATIAATPKPREDYGLPPDAVVLCSFNHARKLNPSVFAIWLQVLRDIPNTVLWLSAPEYPGVAERLRANTQVAGIAPERIHFAPRLQRSEDHLARYAVTDLALDTFPYGSHSTALDAIGQGCPLIALAGRSFASRVSASLLAAAGTPELIASDPEHYRRLIAELACAPERRAELRARLETSRGTCTLFDTLGFVRALESAYRAVHERNRLGLGAAHLSIADPI